MLVLITLSLVFLTNASTFTDNVEGDFNSGTYNETHYNSTGNFVQLNTSYNNGTYISQIFNAGSSSTWGNISWVSNAIGELPSNGVTETSFDNGNANMTGNVLLMHMNEASGIIVDYSGAGNNGTTVGDPTYGVAGKINDAISFEGDNEGINLSNGASINPSAEMTVSSWVNLDTGNTKYGVILSRWGTGGNAYFIGTLPNSYAVVIYFSGGLRYTTPALPTGEWVHLLVTNNGAGNNVTAYQNGVYLGEGVSGGAITSSTAPSSIGYDVSRINYPFKGDIDEVAIWNRTLSPSEITDLYKRGAMKLNLTARSCDDAACDTEIWVEANDSTPQNFSLNNNTFFQYRFKFETDNESA
ncbi:MAG: LamG domain-containing protein, partial [Firmicutes bacterium]|nr:LamG domain-containing protein [Bacillota bacterium]